MTNTSEQLKAICEQLYRIADALEKQNRPVSYAQIYHNDVPIHYTQEEPVQAPVGETDCSPNPSPIPPSQGPTDADIALKYRKWLVKKGFPVPNNRNGLMASFKCRSLAEQKEIMGWDQ